MSDPTLPDIDIKNKMALVLTTLKMHSSWLSENEGFRGHKHDGTKIKNDKVWKLLGRPRTRTVGMPISHEKPISHERQYLMSVFSCIFMFLMILSSWLEFEVHAEFLDRELSWLSFQPQIIWRISDWRTHRQIQRLNSNHTYPSRTMWTTSKF